MADTEIQILITAVDKATATLNRIQGTLSETNKEMQRETKKTSQTFDSQVGTLIALGNAANSVEGIFSTYQNTQLRLENAGERVANSQDRLRKAQSKLNDIVAQGKTNSKEYTEAQMELTSASRGVTIASNNLARAQNAVLGNYISMGVQSLTLIASFPRLAAGAASFATSLTGVAVSATAAGVALGGITIAVAEVIYFNNQFKTAASNLESTMAEIAITSQQYGEGILRIKKETWGWAEAIDAVKNKLQNQFTATTPEKAKLLEEQAILNEKRAELAIRRAEGQRIEAGATELLQQAIDKNQRLLDLENAKEARNQALIVSAETRRKSEEGLLNVQIALQEKSLESARAYIDTAFGEDVTTMRTASYDAETERLKALLAYWDELVKKAEKYNKTIQRGESGARARGNVLDLLKPGGINNAIGLNSMMNN